MHKNPLFLALLGLISLAFLWFAGIAGYQLYLYHSLDTPTTASVDLWDIEHKSDEEYLVSASYTYRVQEKLYNGKTIFNDWPFRNPWAAEELIKTRKKQKWTAWYNASNPSYSSLQKNFPSKECLSAGMLGALLLYFLWLSFYIPRRI